MLLNCFVRAAPAFLQAEIDALRRALNNKQGSFQHPVSEAVLSAFYSLISAWVVERIKRGDEKQRLINLFIAEIGRTNLEIDRKKNVLTRKLSARAKGELFGIGDVTFTGKPEYELEVYNARLYETEGIRLAQLLGSRAREHFWAANGYLRDAEVVRLVIKQLKTVERDYEAYEKVFTALVKKGSSALVELYRDLWDERSFIRTWIDVIRTSKS